MARALEIFIHNVKNICSNISNEWINPAKKQLCYTVRTENKDLGSDPVSILPDTSVAESAVKCSLVPVNLPAFMRLIIVKQ